MATSVVPSKAASSSSSASIASKTARLQETLATLQSQRDELLLSLSARLPSSPHSPTITSSSSTTSHTTLTADAEPSANEDGETDKDKDGTPTVTPPSIPTEAILAFANETVAKHIRQLHAYNELKDIGMGFLGLIADQRGVRVVDVMEEFGVSSND